MALSEAFNASAVALGNVILISSTSCLTVIFTAMLSPVLLKEKFQWRRDGVSIALVGLGSIIAIS